MIFQRTLERLMASLPDVDDLKLVKIVAWNRDNPNLEETSWLLQIEPLMTAEGEFIVVFEDDLDKWPTLKTQFMSVRFGRIHVFIHSIVDL